MGGIVKTVASLAPSISSLGNGNILGSILTNVVSSALAPKPSAPQIPQVLQSLPPVETPTTSVVDAASDAAVSLRASRRRQNTLGLQQSYTPTTQTKNLTG